MADDTGNTGDNFSTAETQGVDIAQLVATPTTPAAIPGTVAPQVNPQRGAITPPATPPITGNAINVDSFLGQAHVDFLKGQSSILQGVPSGVGTIIPGADLAIQGEQLRLQGQQQINTLEQAQAAQVKAADQAMAQRLGLIPGAGNMNIAAISDNIRTSQAGVMQHQAQIEQRMNMSFLDNPIAWIMNQISLPSAIQQLGVEEAGVKNKFEVLGELQKLMDDQHKTNVMIDQNVGTAKAAALNMVAMGEAKLRLSQSMFEAAKTGATLANVRLIANKQQFDQAYQLNEAQNQSTQTSIRFRELTLQEESSQRAEEQHNMTMNLEKIQLGNAQRQQEAKIEMQQQLDKVAVAFNFNKIPVDQFNQLGDGPFRRFLTEQMLNPNIQQAGVYGRDAANSLALVNSQNFTLTPGSEFVRQQLTKYMQDTIAGYKLGETAWKSLDPSVKLLEVQKGLTDRINQQMKVIPDSGGLFSPAPLISTLKIPAIQGTAIGQSLSAAGNNDERYATKAQDFFASAANLISQGKITPGQAVEEIVQSYKAIQLDTNQRNMYQRFGFDGLNATTGFKQTVVVNNFLGSSTVVDMTNKAQVEAALARMRYGQTTPTEALAPQFGP